MAHPGDKILHDLTLGRLPTAGSLQVQKHIYGCPECLKHLRAVELDLAYDDVENPSRRLLKPDMSKPLYMRHDTADGFIYSRVERIGQNWLERHWGDQLQGQHECETLEMANQHAIVAFEQMFPEHRCTERCCLNPK